MCARERKTKKRQFYLPRETEPVISREKRTFLFTTFVTSEQQFSNDASSIDANVFSPLSILFSHGMVYQPSFTPFRIPACQVKYKWNAIILSCLLNVSKLLPSFNHYKNLLLDFEKIGNVLGHLKTTRGNLKQFSQMLWIVLVTFIFSRSRDIFTAVFCLLDTLMSGILILEHVKRPKITANKKDKKLLPHFKRLMFRRDSFTPKTKSHYSSYW